MTTKRDTFRPYPPDYVSAETLAYRLDMSRSAVYADVKKGLLPQPVLIGGKPRWRWSDVEACIRSQNGDVSQAYQQPDTIEGEDLFIAGIRRVASTYS